MNNIVLKKVLTLFLSIVTLFTCAGCTFDNRHNIGTYSTNNNSGIQEWDDIGGGNVIDWDNADINSWSEVDDVTQWVYAELLFDGITDEYASVTTLVLDYKSNGQYFDGDRVYKLVGKKFDLNPLISKFAIGSGVIVVCVVLNVLTAGVTTPVACFIAGAASGAVSSAVKGAAMGAAMGAISNAIKSGGDWQDTLYGALEGASSGYMWGAIFGAISGGLNSNYCFTSDTQVLTSNGMMEIEKIKEGDYVYSYNEIDGNYSYQMVTKKMLNQTYRTIKVYTQDDCIESTINHPYYTDLGWMPASELSIGTKILSNNGDYKTVNFIENKTYDKPVKIYNLSVENNHTFLVGEDSLVVHNKCNINSEYSGKNYKLDGDLAKKYPDGVNFSKDGYPDFSPYAKKILTFDYPSKNALANGTCLNGNYNHDFAMANKLAGYGNTPGATPAGYTWHHDESMRRLLLIPQDLHRAVRHTGGASLIKALLSSLI